MRCGNVARFLHLMGSNGRAIAGLIALVFLLSETWSTAVFGQDLEPILPKRVGPTFFAQVGEPPGSVVPRVRAQLPPPVPQDPMPGFPEADGFERLPSLPDPSGDIPKPSASRQRVFDRFVEKTIEPERNLDVFVSRPRLLLLRQAPLRYQIADEEIASVDIITETEISVSGRSIGTTVLNLWFTDDQNPGEKIVLSYLVRVHPDPVSRVRIEQIYRALQDEINQAFPDSVVELSFVGNEVLVRGQAKDILDATMILRAVGANSQRRSQTVPIEQLNLQIAGANYGEESDPVEDAVVRGEQAAEYLRAVASARQQGVINMLRVPGEQQVNLRVTVAEVNRSAARSIGLNFQINSQSGVPVFSQLTGGLITAAAGGGAGTMLAGNLPTILDNGQVPIAINALRQLGLARSLAEPNLMTINGQVARFHAGGSFPVPVVTGATAIGLQGVAYVPFGVQLNFRPTITDKDRIRLLVSATVSTRDESIGTNIGGAGGGGGGGSSVPGLQSRNFNTTVELRNGQTLAVAGLIQNNYGANSSRVPLAGDLPLLGRLFSNNGASAQEQELVVLVTPELVHPLDAGEASVLPGQDIYEPDDVEFFLLGRLESRRSEDYRSAVRTDSARLKNYRRCQQHFIIGPSGHSDGRY